MILILFAFINILIISTDARKNDLNAHSTNTPVCCDLVHPSSSKVWSTQTLQNVHIRCCDTKVRNNTMSVQKNSCFCLASFFHDSKSPLAYFNIYFSYKNSTEILFRVKKKKRKEIYRFENVISASLTFPYKMSLLGLWLAKKSQTEANKVVE